jgi:GNAT superfamily N-acetyltransferase
VREARILPPSGPPWPETGVMLTPFEFSICSRCCDGKSLNEWAMPELTFRYAKPPDAPAIRALIERCYRGDGARAGWTSEADLLAGPRTSETEVHDLIVTPGHYFVLGESDGELLATALLERRDHDAYFGMLAIEPATQGSGIGKQFIGRLEQAARELWRSKAMTIVVINLRDELIAWYERRGYAPTGKTHPFPFGETTGELRRDFHLVEMRKDL